MPVLDVYNLKRTKVGELALADDVFAVEIKEHLMHEVVVGQLATRRAGTRAGKERSAVQGSTRKVHKQKGTGQARHGDIRAPIFVGGGRAHPPKPQDWTRIAPRRVRLGALTSALSLLVKEGRLTVVDEISLSEIKTKALAATLKILEVPEKTLVVDESGNETLKLSIRNMPRFQFLPPEGVNVYDLLRHRHLLVSKAAVKAIERRCQRGRSAKVEAAT